MVGGVGAAATILRALLLLVVFDDDGDDVWLTAFAHLTWITSS